jgi:diguanylate cyclase (GGDEF)-like protein/PAS domain S-box-containing protein
MERVSANPAPTRPATAWPASRDHSEDRPVAERLVAMTGDLLAVVDGDGRFVFANPAWERTLGYPPSVLAGSAFAGLMDPSERDIAARLVRDATASEGEVSDVTFRMRHRDGSWRSLLWNCRFDGRGWYLAARDVTDRARLEQQALHDPLTGLPNRVLLFERTRRALKRVGRGGGLVALLFVDLDRFKVINDSLGHTVGDQLLIAMADRLRQTVRDADTVARLGGDEFVILAEDLVGDEQALVLASRIERSLRAPVELGTGEVAITASVGVTTSADPAASPDALLREADVAMYRAKAQPRCHIELFDQQVRREVLARLETESRLREALPRDELRLVYQPLVRIGDGQVVGCEALLRWAPAGDAALVPPDVFLPLAEENGLIVPMGAWVLHEACVQAAAWRRGGRDVSISVNVSSRQLAEPDFVEIVGRTLRSTGLPAPCLCLEITETVVLRDPERAGDMLRRVRLLGARTAIDDFGRGFSSLSHLIMLPVDVLKIDRSFISGLDRAGDARAVVMAMMALANEMGLTVVAEGIESEHQLELVREVGCHLAQGFFLARPGPPEQVLERIPVVSGRSPGDPYVIREFMRQIGIPARIQ